MRVLICMAALAICVTWTAWRIQGAQQVKRAEVSKKVNSVLVRELRDQREQYNRTVEPQRRQALAWIILRKVDGYSQDSLTPDALAFVRQLQTDLNGPPKTVGAAN